MFRGFKALKQSTKLLFLTLHRPADALKTYTELLSYTKSAVTRNVSEKSINSILDYVGEGGKSGKRKGGQGGKGTVVVDVEVLERFYEATREALGEAKNDVSDMVICPSSADKWWRVARGYPSRRTSSSRSCGWTGENSAGWSKCV